MHIKPEEITSIIKKEIEALENKDVVNFGVSHKWLNSNASLITLHVLLSECLLIGNHESSWDS